MNMILHKVCYIKSTNCSERSFLTSSNWFLFCYVPLLCKRYATSSSVIQPFRTNWINVLFISLSKWLYQSLALTHFSSVLHLIVWKASKYEVFLVRIFLYSVRIQENTDQKKPPYFDTFHVVSQSFDLQLICTAHHQKHFRLRIVLGNVLS